MKDSNWAECPKCKKEVGLLEVLRAEMKGAKVVVDYVATCQNCDFFMKGSASFKVPNKRKVSTQ